MPQVTYRGRWPTKRTPFGTFNRYGTVEVTQEWLEANRRRVTDDPDFEVVGDEAEGDSLDGDNPDEGWTRAQIYEWLTLHDIRARAGLTKPQLLATVRGALGMEEEVESEEEPDDSTEDSMSAPVVDEDMVAADSNDEQQEEVID